MKTSLKYMLPALGVAFMLGACSEDSWNDKLDGFQVPDAYSKTETITYTLTDANYSQLAKLNTNQAIAASLGEEAELAAIGANATFTSEEQARKYIPAFLRDSVNFPYFTLNDGSSVSVTYNLTTAIPEAVQAINSGVVKYELTTEDYQELWGSDENFINGFAPSKPFAWRTLISLLNNSISDTEAGKYVVVTYQETDQEPIFSSVGGNETVFTHNKVTEMSDGVFAIVCDGNAAYTVAESYSYGYLKAYEVVEGDNGLNLTEDENTCNFTFTSVAGGYTIQDIYGRYLYMDESHDSFQFSATNPEDGSQVWAVAPQADGTMKITNTLRGKYIQWSANYGSYGAYSTDKGAVPSLYKKNEAAAKGVKRVLAAEVPLSTHYAIILRTNGDWKYDNYFYVIQPEDYSAMGQNYGNFSSNNQYTLLPIFLKGKYPYAAADEVRTIVYLYYNGSSTAYMATEYTFDGAEWVRNQGQTTDKFTRKNGYWDYNPSVDLTLPYARNTDPSYTVYMACVNWVWNNICLPMGDTEEMLTNKETFLDYRKNAEFYSGASAYYGNVDIRSTTALNNAPEGYTGYEGLSADQITLLLKKRFSTQVLLGALEALYPDAAPVEGMDVTYSITFTAYDGAANVETIVYKVIGKGQFEYISSTWVDDATSADWKANPIEPIK